MRIDFDENSVLQVSYGAVPASADLQLAIKYDTEVDKEKTKEVDNWTYTARNCVLFHLEGAPLTAEKRIEQARRNQRVINKTATRFPQDVKIKPSKASMARASMMQLANNAGKVDVLGIGLNSTTVHEIGLNSKTLSLVATPSAAPCVDDSPLMTWGEIGGTPFRLDAADVQVPKGNAPTFKMPEVPFREQVAQGISDTIAKRYRDKRKAAMKAAEKAHRTPRFGSARSSALSMATLSPAARRLASNKLGIRLPSTAQHLRSVTPLRPNSSRVTSKIVSPTATPSKRPSTTADDSGGSQEDRCRAGDFF